jgi:hypothetical protein
VNCVGPSATAATPAQPTQPAQPTCDVSLYSQNVFGSPFLHTFIQDSWTSGGTTTTQDFEAIPVSTGLLQLTLENANDAANNGNYYKNNPSSLLFDLGAVSTCAEANSIQSLAASFNSNTSLTYSLPYNSNSFTYSLLTYSGTPIPSTVSSYLNSPVSLPVNWIGIGLLLGLPRAPGWGGLIPQWGQ